MLEKNYHLKAFNPYLRWYNLRYGLNKDLGFKKEDRIENLRRVSEVAKILHDTGVIVLASYFSLQKDRERIGQCFQRMSLLRYLWMLILKH